MALDRESLLLGPPLCLARIMWADSLAMLRAMGGGADSSTCRGLWRCPPCLI